MLDHLTGYEHAQPGADRQRRLRPAPARRLGRPARLGVPAPALGRVPHRPCRGPGSSDRWSSADRALARARPRASGRCAASRSTSRRRRSCAGSRCDRGAQAGRGASTSPSWPQRWRPRPTRSRPTCCEHGVDERGVLTQVYGADALDASLLLAPLMRFLPPDDPRMRATVLAIADELTRRRTRAALPRRGDRRRPRGRGGRRSRSARSGWSRRWWRSASSNGRATLCERMLSFASPLGLYAEEIDPRTGRHWGNFPQAFTHLALINALDARDPGRGAPDGAARLEPELLRVRRAARRAPRTLSASRRARGSRGRRCRVRRIARRGPT